MTLTSIFYDFFHIFLRIISSGSSGSILSAIRTSAVPPTFPVWERTIGRFTRQFRIFLDFNSPSGSIRQVPVETVQLITGQRINLFLDKFFCIEMTWHIQVHASIRKARSIFYRHFRKPIRTTSALTRQLHNRLKSIKQPRSWSSLSLNTFFCHFQTISLFFHLRIFRTDKFKSNVSLSFLLISQRQRRITHIRYKIVFISSCQVTGERCLCTKHKMSVPTHHLLRIRNHIRVRYRRSHGRKSHCHTEIKE